MNRRKMQLDICRAMLTPNKKLYGARTDNDEYAVTDGYVAYVFGRDECVFDKKKLSYYDQLAGVLRNNKGDVELTRTGRLYGESVIVVEFDAGGKFQLYANADYVKEFEGYHLFAYSQDNRVLVKDDFGKTIGRFMPRRRGDSGNGNG
jgi:hypothetical protein